MFWMNRENQELVALAMRAKGFDDVEVTVHSEKATGDCDSKTVYIREKGRCAPDANAKAELKRRGVGVVLFDTEEGEDILVSVD